MTCNLPCMTRDSVVLNALLTDASLQFRQHMELTALNEWRLHRIRELIANVVEESMLTKSRAPDIFKIERDGGE